MKTILLLSFVLSAMVAQAQEPRVMFHLQTSDTLAHKSLVMQVSNLKKEMPQAVIIIIAHGPGIEFIVKKKSRYVDRLEKMKLKDVSVIGCEFTMAQFKLTKEDIVPFASTVSHAITEIVRRQTDNWLYIKTGF